MPIKKFNRKEYDPDYFSKTQQKNESLQLKKFGLELTELPSARLEKLPIAEVTLKSLLDYKKITANLARKRHLMFIGKCLREEDEEAIRECLAEQESNELKEKSSTENKSSVNETDQEEDKLIEQLIEFGDSKIEELLIENPMLERQTLRQILRNINVAKNAQKKNIAINKMKNYLAEFQSD